ncbi:MAG: DUF177 domain-containing protein [Lachnospiraceae bacterium]|nr:DUF177 domain-containing protein [Lachnospiraceae bacterium]
MLINLSDAFNTSGKSMEINIHPELTSYDGGLGEFKMTSCEDFVLKVTNLEKGKVNISGNVKLSFEGQCDRCLKSTPVNLDISIDKNLASPDYEAGDEEEDLYDYMDGYNLDSEELLQGEITVNWPVKILCREDCKGLCPVCGHDLNEGDCGCDTFVPDPRMAAIFDKLESTKEV